MTLTAVLLLISRRYDIMMSCWLTNPDNRPTPAFILNKLKHFAVKIGGYLWRPCICNFRVVFKCALCNIIEMPTCRWSMCFCCAAINIRLFVAAIFSVKFYSPVNVCVFTTINLHFHAAYTNKLRLSVFENRIMTLRYIILNYASIQNFEQLIINSTLWL